jgi:hypothetical protein
MGFESFQVRLEGGQSTQKDVVATLVTLDGVSRDREAEFTPGWPCFLFRDGRHAIEVEVAEGCASISCRFTLCHPPSVDKAFLDLIKRFMERFGMRARICDDVTPEHSNDFALDHFDEFAQATLGYIAARRLEWKSMFGDQQMAATTAEAHEHIISAHYVTSVEKAS